MEAVPAPVSSPPVTLPLPLATPPPPSVLPPMQSQPNVGSDSPPPRPANSSNSSTSPPPSVTSAPPPSVPVSSPPPPSRNASPPASPPILSPPPPSILSPPPVSTPPPALVSPPPIAASPPTPTLSPPLPPADPPPVVSPPPSSPPPPQAASPSPPLIPSPPQAISPPAPIVSPPPPSATPPENSPPAPIVSPPPPSATPPENSPPAPVLRPPSPAGTPPSSNSPPNQSSPPPLNQHQAPPPPPRNSSPPGIPPTTPLLSPPAPPGNVGPPVSTSPTNSSNPSPNVDGGSPTSSSGNGTSKMGSAVGISVGVLLLLFVIGLAVWCVVKKKRKGRRFDGYVIPTPLSTSQRSDISYSKPLSSAPLIGNSSSGSRYPYSPPEPGGLGKSRSNFTYEELLQVTNGFSEYNLLGEGGFGCVYKGCLPDGREVAVKQLKVGGAQGEREFQAEVEIISRVHHRHLVSLVGYCIAEHQRLLVYDYVPNNTLYHHLHGEGRPVLDWATRLKVAAGAARGIAYLHEDCHPRIIHRDIKSSNILLDNDFEAQVSDFGLARLALDSFTHVTTRVMGTFGYLAPEYASSGKLTEKSDVFSFGVVLLELLTGRKPVDGSQPLGDESLVEWARPLLSRALDSKEYEGLVDPRLGKNYVEIEMFRVIEAAAACVRHSAGKRPRMGQVVRALDSIYDSLDLNNGIKPGQSKLFDSAQLSAEIRDFQRMAFGSQDYSSDFSQTSWRTQRE